MLYLYGIVFLLSVLLMAAVWLLYRYLLAKGENLLRLEPLERQLAQSNSQEDVESRWRRLVHPVAINESYERHIIFHSVVHGDEYQIQSHRFEPGDVVIDIGANIGTFSLLCQVLGSRAIFAFEPCERSFRLLKENVGSLPGVHVFPSAIWRSDGEVLAELSFSEGYNSGQHSVMAAGRVFDFAEQRLLHAYVPSYKTSAVALDRVLERFERVKLLKIDCEGREFPILLTSRRLERVAWLVGEIHQMEERFMDALDAHSRVAGYPTYRLEHLVAWLESCGFQVSTRLNDQRHIYLFDARRRGAKPV